MRKGIDVSCFNDGVDWKEVRGAGMEFAIIRLGYGHRHLDELFYKHVNGALDAGLLVGTYYYSYALCPEDGQRRSPLHRRHLRGLRPSARTPRHGLLVRHGRRRRMENQT